MRFAISELYTRYPSLQALENNISKAFSFLDATVSANGKILICGNGGSASDAEHMSGELLKSFLKKRPVNSNFLDKLQKMYGTEKGLALADGLEEGIKAISLISQTAFLTAFSNDRTYSMVFAQQVFVLGEEKDCLVAFSCSGNSDNIVNALMVAGAIGMKRILFSASDGGEAAKFADALINVPEKETYKAQELHLPIYHALCAQLEERHYGSK